MPGFLQQLHKRRVIAASAGETPLSYLQSNYDLDHWFATTEFNGASSDGDSITSWGDLVTTSNAAVGSSLNPNPILRVVGGRNYASFNEGTTRTVFVMPEATFAGVGGFDATGCTIFMKTANITSTSELGAYTKGKENAFATAENQLLLDSNSYTLRSQGTNDSSRSHPLDDGDYIIVRVDGTNTKLYTYDISATTITQRSDFTNGTSTDSGNLFFGGVEAEDGNTQPGAKWYCSDLLFFGEAMTTTEMADVIDQVEQQ